MQMHSNSLSDILPMNVDTTLIMCRAFLFCFVVFCFSPMLHLVFVTLKLSEAIFQILMSARQKPTNVKLRKCATIPGLSYNCTCKPGYTRK